MTPKRLTHLNRRHFRAFLRRFHPTPHSVSTFPLIERGLEHRAPQSPGRFVVDEEEVPAAAGKLLRLGVGRIGRIGGERGRGERVRLRGGVALEVPLGGLRPIIGLRQGIVFRGGGIGALEHNGGRENRGVLWEVRGGRGIRGIRGIVETALLQDGGTRSKKPAQFREGRLIGFFRGGLEGAVGGERVLRRKGETWNREGNGF